MRNRFSIGDVVYKEDKYKKVYKRLVINKVKLVGAPTYVVYFFENRTIGIYQSDILSLDEYRDKQLENLLR